MKDSITNDPIVAEIHAFRERRARRFKHDIDAMFEDLRRMDEQAEAQGAIVLQPPKDRGTVSKARRVQRRKAMHKKGLTSSKP